MKNIILSLLLVAAISGRPARAQTWSIPITPPFGGPTFNVGAWPNDHDCADMDGSFMYSHDPRCHLDGVHCGITGNGQAYPAGTPYPATKPIPGACIKGNSTMAGRRFLEYHALPTPGGSAPLCSELPKYQALATKDPQHYSVATVRQGCGGPCWPSQHDNACE